MVGTSRAAGSGTGVGVTTGARRPDRAIVNSAKATKRAARKGHKGRRLGSSRTEEAR